MSPLFSSQTLGGYWNKWGGFSYTQTGGTVTQSGPYTVITWSGNGSFKVTSGVIHADILVVAGGGGGGPGNCFGYSFSSYQFETIGAAGGSGGGAGGVNYQPSTLLSVASGSQTVVIGAQGAGGTQENNLPYNTTLVMPTNGGGSSFGSFSASGGGNGGIGTGGPGGTSGNGYGSATNSSAFGAGGGGATSAGVSAEGLGSPQGFLGGAGFTSPIDNLVYASGGTAPNPNNAGPSNPGSFGNGGYGGYVTGPIGSNNAKFSFGGYGQPGGVIIRFLG
jgi:hypothetical protein